MSAKKSGRRQAVILLVVLGMLSLLSLLAVTYVVSSGQSRTGSLAMAHRDFHQTPPDRLIDQGLKQVLRGTTDRHSAAWKNDLLGDLYGSQEFNAGATVAQDLPIFLGARTVSSGVVLRDNPERVKAFPYYVDPPLNNFMPSSPEAPEFYGTGSSSNFLKIPLAWPNDTNSTIVQKLLPEQSDAWNGRVVTFLRGPLENQSLRIVRYVGEVDLVRDNNNQFKLNPDRANLQYSITVDLADVKDNYVTVKSSSGKWDTKTVSQWSQLPLGAAALVYQDYATLANPYPMMVNAGVQNSYGGGYEFGSAPAVSQFNTVSSDKTVFDTVFDSYLPHHAFKNSAYQLAGDTDEPYDAADYQNFFLALKQAAVTGSDASDDIIPSFHRPAVINYLAKGAVNLNDSAVTYTDPAVQRQFRDFVFAVGRATARPLSYNISNFPLGAMSNNVQFSGSNSLNFPSGLGARAPHLTIDWSLLPKKEEQDKMEAWIRWLTRGPWDVDNDSEGVRDSVWVDLNYPLMTSPEGRLLKILVAFYIEDMDGKLDINAAGGWDSTSGAPMGAGLNKYAHAYPNSASASFTPGHWPQGLGYGPAEISLRPALTTDAEYSQLLTNRYSSTVSTDIQPGFSGKSDSQSAVLERNRDNEPSTYTLVANGFYKSTFPLAVRGKSGLGLDLLGNPIMVESSNFGETVDDPYDAKVLFHNRFDRHFSLAEYQRLVRFNDLDRSGSSRRLQYTAASSFTPSFASSAAYLNRVRSISPRNVSLTLPRFAVNYLYPRVTNGSVNPAVVTNATRRVSSFVEFVEAFAQNKPLSTTSPLSGTPPAPYFNNVALNRLFPVEFMQNRPLNLNRPLGNGQDDDADGLIDEADEVNSGQLGTYPGWQNNAYREEYLRDTAGLDAELEGEVVGLRNSYGGNGAKQLLARHLYCLAQLILPADYRFPNQPDPTTTLTAPERARILAQWAINVVDFRDPDSAMTRFAYDATPFVPKSGVYWVPVDGIVWGVEQNELVMTETLAFHDLRIRVKPGSSNPTVYEQLRVPQGSLYMEFLCPRTLPTTVAGDTTLPPAMFGLYKLSNGIPALDMGAFVQDPPNSATNTTNTAINYPKWRVAFLKPRKEGALFLDAPSKAYEGTAANRFNYSYQVGTEKAGLKWFLGSGTADPLEPEIDRIMWFANIDPDANNHAWPSVASKPPTPEDKIFRWTAGSNASTPMVGGGQYLIVGPREFNYLGSKKQSGTPKHMPSNHRIQLTNNWLQIWNQENDPSVWIPGVSNTPLVKNGQATAAPQAPFSPKVRDCVTMTAGMKVPADWDTDPDITNKYIGLNVSEPTREAYYTKPGQWLNRNDTATPSDPDNNAVGFKNMSKDAYIDLSDNSGAPPNKPLDIGSTSYLKASDRATAQWEGTDYPDIKTEKHWSAAVLQRLADPMRPYHEKYNPYITVDWMPIDLTVFSGEATLSPNGDIFLASRHKTGATLSPSQQYAKAGEPAATSPLAGTTFYSYHNQVTETKSTAVGATTQAYFDYELATEYYAKTGAVTIARSGIAEFSTLGYLNPRFVIRGTWNFPVQASPIAESKDDYEHAYFLGSPGPNPWATDKTGTLLTANAKFALKTPLAPYFPNRDFVNALELTSVPLSSPGQFFQDFSVQLTDLKIPKFPYTIDFEDLLPNPPTAGQKRSSAILLDCVAVPSPWGDSWKVVHPESVRGYPTPYNNPKERSQTMLFEHYRAPYNTIPTFVEPGKINLNTATENTVYRGLMWNIMTPVNTRATVGTIPYFGTLVPERQGYMTGSSKLSSQPNPHLNDAYPTEFARLYTSSLTPDKFPEAVQQVTRASDVGPLRHRNLTNADMRVFDPSESGVFPDDGASSDKPTGWQYRTSIPINSFTHNYPAARMANLTTDRSNVFAIRMTLGYFECDSSGAIGAEYGAEQGRTKRHRAYYLIDRSIPVGYQTGHDTNVENCVLLRSVVE